MRHGRPVLILGGSGQAGSGTARLLRHWYPELPLTVAGRDLGRARRVVGELGAATAVTVDLGRDDLGLPAGPEYGAVVATLWDDRLNGLEYARRLGVPYVSLSSSLPDIGVEVVAGLQRPVPLLLASQWCAGVLSLAVLDLAREFGRVDAVRIAAVLDGSDTGGPAGVADLERWSTVTSAGLERRDGRFIWVDGPEADVEVPTLDGRVLIGRSTPVLDVPSLALATGARDVRFAFAVGESEGSRRGAGPSVEMRIDLRGTGTDGAPRRVTRALVHPEGQRPLTALGLALGVERLLGLRGDGPAAPGLYTPETLIDPVYAGERLGEIGARWVEVGVGVG
ncbi:saccharopine dehydrogenase [Streptomyces sp. NPDC004610]|uniref:saccharopine dehydrogenase n=1 Tax=unclassified Streptomyces TaxID=2593676 RepID=UPI0033A863B3